MYLYHYSIVFVQSAKVTVYARIYHDMMLHSRISLNSIGLSTFDILDE